MRLNVLAVLLFAVQWMTITLAGIGPSADCCNKVTGTKTSVTNIVKYVLQDAALCPIKAVKFTTIKHKVICSDPESRWAKFAMCVVDKRKSTDQAESICRNLTMVTAPSKPSMTVPPKTSTTVPSEPSTTVPSEPSTTVPSEPSTTAPSNPSTRVPSEPSTTAPSNSSTTVPPNPSTTATPVSVPSKKTVGRIETETTVKSLVADDSLKSSPNFNRESAETSSVEEGDESESRKSSDENESPAGISKTKNTELEESLHAEERETLSSTMNENKNTMFCIKRVPDKSSSAYFCIKDSL